MNRDETLIGPPSVAARSMATILVDLWGVLCNSEEGGKSYRLVMSEILAAEYGGDRRVWLRAYDEAYLWYVQEARAAEKRHDPYRSFMERIDAQHIQTVFEIAGVPFPETDPLALAQDVEQRTLLRSASPYPDVRTALTRLRQAGHAVYLATGATESNATGAVRGMGIGGMFDGILTGDRLDAFKSEPQYWTRALAHIERSPKDCVAVDDSLRVLQAATAVGVTGLLVDRLGAHPAESAPTFVTAVLRHLAGLPHYIEAIRGPSA